MKVKDWIKLIITASALHIALLAISVSEVLIYSILIEPGHDQTFYSHHAETVAPWVSGVFGSIFIFLLVRRFAKQGQKHQLLFSICLPAIFILIDVTILLVTNKDWPTDYQVFSLSNDAKFIAALLSYQISISRRV